MKIIDKFRDEINGVLTAFDRMIIKGHILQLFSDSGKRYFLSQENVLLKDYGGYAERVTKSIKASIEEMTSETGRPLIYLSSSKASKYGGNGKIAGLIAPFPFLRRELHKFCCRGHSGLRYQGTL